MLKNGPLNENLLIFTPFLNKICIIRKGSLTFDLSKRKRRRDNQPCSVVKLADTPSYLGGEEQWDKLRLFGAATNHFVEVQVLPLQLIKKGDFLAEVAFFVFTTYAV
ncbi:MAG: hypothetical protein ACRYFV_03080 [Janthinobacterium lividum]